MARYWITTHWPPEIIGGTFIDYGVYLYDGTQSVGVDIELGDRVWIYQSKGGKAVLREQTDGSKYKSKREQGKEGVIALTEVVNKLHDMGGEPEEYVDHTRRWWRWKADTRLINQSGFIPRRELGILLYNSPNCPFHGFGTKRSGLKQIGEDVHKKLLDSFNRNQPSETKPIKRDTMCYGRKGHGKGGEGKTHKMLKEEVAAKPSEILGIENLSLIQMEYPFPTGDRIDVLLKDAENRYAAVEVEVAVDLDDISGVLQAIKYSRMYAVECRRKFEEVRAFLVAHKISDDVMNLCNMYGIETFVVERS